jgi:hypothetical protein
MERTRGLGTLAGTPTVLPKVSLGFPQSFLVLEQYWELDREDCLAHPFEFSSLLH